MEWAARHWHSTGSARPPWRPPCEADAAAATLSKAKHQSLTGHARMARRVASLLPFYEYDEARFFRSDDAPERSPRGAGPASCGCPRSSRSASPRRCSHRGSARRHLRSAVHRCLSGALPVQPHRAPAPAARRVPAIVRRRDASPTSTATSPTTSPARTASIVFGYDFYKDCMDARP